MRKTILWILPMLGLAVAATSHAKSVVINPQAGFVGSSLTSDPTEIDDQARLGYSVGGQVRLGGRGYVAPGVFWQHSSLEATALDDATLDPNDNSVLVLAGATELPATTAARKIVATDDPVFATGSFAAAATAGGGTLTRASGSWAADGSVPLK